MQRSRRAIRAIFVLALAALLVGGVVFVAGQAIALIAGQADWLQFFSDVFKPPLCIAASVCAVTGFLLSYKHPQKQVQAPQKATTR